MSLSAKIREQLISSFRAELSEHVQTMNDGLLALEQGRVKDDERQSMLGDIFRAAHSLKGAALQLGLGPVGELAVAAEEVAKLLHREGHTLPPEGIEVLDESAGRLAENLASLEQEEPPQASPEILGRLHGLAGVMREGEPRRRAVGE